MMYYPYILVYNHRYISVYAIHRLDELDSSNLRYLHRHINILC